MLVVRTLEYIAALCAAFVGIGILSHGEFFAVILGTLVTTTAIASVTDRAHLLCGPLVMRKTMWYFLQCAYVCTFGMGTFLLFSGDWAAGLLTIYASLAAYFDTRKTSPYVHEYA